MKSSQNPIRVVIADDQKMLAGLLANFLTQKGFVVAGMANNGEELMARVAEVLPDVVLTDINMPVMDGIEAMQRLGQLYPTLGVIALTQHDEQQFIIDMLHAGAKGFLYKDESLDEISDALEAVHTGRNYYCSKVSIQLLRRIVREDADPFRKKKIRLSEHEKDVIRLICQDFSSREIGEKLNRSMNTIKKTRQVIMEKLGVKGTAGIVLYAVKAGIYPLAEVRSNVVMG